ncbi:MAG: glycosyltransferase family 39 protein [Chloroflexota bacterium]|nr:glycosyltransferase family 39 protein [Chloroflexota bacterium]
MTRFCVPRPASRMPDTVHLSLIILLFLALGVIYSLATPILEASDEFKHYPYVQYVQTHHDLPVLDLEACLESPDDCPWLQDGGQPPAYYALMAAATSWIDTSDLYQVRWMNWHAFIGDPAQVCNKNLVVHRLEQERFPWHGSVLAIHLIRFLTLGLGAGTVWLTYLLARDLFPDRPDLALGAAALTAFNPMFIFVNAAVNNDALAAFIGCLNLLLFVRLVRDGLRGPLPLWRYGLVGLVIGLFLLTKLSGLGALILLGCLLVWISYRRRSLRPLLVGLPLVVGIALLLSGWWFLRNWRLYGDPAALNIFVAIQGQRAGAPMLRDWLDEFVTFRWTYWGLFGAVDVMAPRWVYTFFDLLSLAGLAGLVVWVMRRRREETRFLEGLWWIPVLWAGVLFVSVLRWTWIYFSFQGRLIFPDIAGISTLLMLGLQQWAPRRYQPALAIGVALILLVIACLIPFVSIIPAYAYPEPLTLADVPAEARVEPIDVDSVARVVGWELEPQVVPPGDRSAHVDFVVYWEAIAPDGKDYISFANLLGRGHQLVGQINRRPACGMVPTSLWEPGQVWRDPYRVPVAEGASAPSRLQVEVGLYDPQAGETLGVIRLGEAKLAPLEAAPVVTYALGVDLADGVTLLGYDLALEGGETPPLQRVAVTAPGEVITLTLYWEAREMPLADYQVFVHLLGDGPEPVAQGDGPPLAGDYPTTMWAPGEVVADPHPVALPVNLPLGQYRLLVGMYDLGTMARLARLDGVRDSIEIPTALEVR